MAWDRCNQDSVWREIEVSTANRGREREPADDHRETRRSAFRECTLCARGSHSLWCRGYEGIHGKIPGSTDSQGHKWRGTCCRVQSVVVRAAITGFYVLRADLDAKCLSRMSGSREGCLHAVGSASSHGERPVITIIHDRL